MKNLMYGLMTGFLLIAFFMQMSPETELALGSTPVSTIAQGGTGWGAFATGTIPIGQGTNLTNSLRFATSSGLNYATTSNTLTVTNLTVSGSCTGCSGGGFSFPFTPTTYSGVGVNATSTGIWLKATSPFSLIASSTFATNASSSLISSTGSGFFATAGGLIGVSSTTPFAKFSVHALSGETNSVLFAIGSSTQTATTTLLSTTAGGQTSACHKDLATSTSISIDWSQSCNSLNIRTGTVATTITLSNVRFGGNKIITIGNPGGVAGAITWAASGAGIQWCNNTPYTQTTGANRGDVVSFTPAQATSTSATTITLIACATPL